MISRRSFLGSIIALAAAPTIVRASSLMQVRCIDAWERIWGTYAKVIADQTFYLNNPIVIDRSVGITRCQFIALRPLPHMLLVKSSADNVIVHGCVFKGQSGTGAFLLMTGGHHQINGVGIGA